MNAIDNTVPAPSVEELQKEIRKLERKLRLAEENIVRAQEVREAKSRVEEVLVKSLIKEQQFFQLILENTTNMLLLLDFDGRLAYASKTFLEALEIENFGLVGGVYYKDALVRHVSDESLLELTNAVDFVLAEKKIKFCEQQIDFNFREDPRIYSVYVIPMIGDDDKNAGIMLLLNDITDINNALIEAERANLAKTNFLTTMSHEIRTPLNAIIGVTQIQLQRKNLPDSYVDALVRIYNSGGNLLGIINDILDLSRIETGKMELDPIEYDVSGLIDDAVRLNIVRIGSKQIRFELDVDENLPSKLVGDELRLKQILNNLISNAIKYTAQGYVKLTVCHRVDDGDTYLNFIVEDTGQGIKPEDLIKLFSEYSRFNIDTNRTTEGTGIGLCITKNLVEMMGGGIEVSSEYGKGSVFSVTVLQQAPQSEPIGPEIARQLRSFAFSGKNRYIDGNIVREFMPYGKVLVVDDVESNLYVASGLLSQYGVKIETVMSGFDAIDKIKNGASYDVIFMDHMMPLMDGIETTKQLRTMGYDGVIVALTASALVGNDVMFKQNGFDGYISKPINVYRLNEVLTQYIRDRYPEEAAKHVDLNMNAKTVQIESAASRNSLLDAFWQDAQNAVASLRETVTDGMLRRPNDLKLFTITVHAMKSALANIGEFEKSALAFELETAGRNGNTEYVLDNTAYFIEMLEALTDSIAKSKSVEKEDSEIREDTGYLTEQLFIVRSACEEYDEATIYAALKLLRKKTWKSENREMLDNIHRLLFLDSDFEAVAERVSERLKTMPIPDM